MAGSPGLDVLLLVLMVVAGMAEIVAFVLVGSWADRRLSSTRQQALDDLQRYGPLAAGLRLELLPPGVRAEVLEARREHGSGSSRVAPATRDSSSAAGVPH